MGGYSVVSGEVLSHSGGSIHVWVKTVFLIRRRREARKKKKERKFWSTVKIKH